MELHTGYNCYVSIEHPSEDTVDGLRKFFNTNHFIIAHNMFEEDWSDQIKLEEIYKKLLLIYQLNPEDENICIVYKDHKRVYIREKQFVPLPPRSVFVYDSSKVDVWF